MQAITSQQSSVQARSANCVNHTYTRIACIIHTFHYITVYARYMNTQIHVSTILIKCTELLLDSRVYKVA